MTGNGPRNILITLSFCGTRYHGFQVQENALSVCEVFQDALEKAVGARCDVKGCSRTDSGVHANKYCLSVKTESALPCGDLVRALNHYLPGDIAVLGACDVPGDFHARYSCTGKEYVYKIHNSHIRDPFSPGLSYRLGFALDEAALHKEAQDFIGTHDFAALCSKDGDIADTVRTVHSFSVTREGEMLLFTVRGGGFLYNMVRIMVGTLVFIGMGRIGKGAIPEIIASKDRSRAGKTMPAQGLYLNDVFYV
ncbi:MAG: tRNA pseudouridine(38-40) synthase TruA [Oscillospiraceae bacterium]|nr:tRNA pseudouridine(38-40) synthase TruA [Oscillospiraceae bacterium]